MKREEEIKQRYERVAGELNEPSSEAKLEVEVKKYEKGLFQV